MDQEQTLDQCVDSFINGQDNIFLTCSAEFNATFQHLEPLHPKFFTAATPITLSSAVLEWRTHPMWVEKGINKTWGPTPFPPKGVFLNMIKRFLRCLIIDSILGSWIKILRPYVQSILPLTPETNFAVWKNDIWFNVNILCEYQNQNTINLCAMKHQIQCYQNRPTLLEPLHFCVLPDCDATLKSFGEWKSYPVMINQKVPNMPKVMCPIDHNYNLI